MPAVNSYVIEVEGIGRVTMERSLRARRVVISIRPFKGVRVAVPRRESFKNAEGFLHLKAGWIKKNMERMKQYEKQRETAPDNLDDIDTAAAKETITSRLKQLAERHGFRYNKLTLRKQRTVWGSCSPRNNISLNIKLVKLPEELMDYVILHELVHTHEHNHGKKFWAKLDGYVGNARAVAKRLRARGLGVG
ncbi:MAG: M48 family metallopeptidase [Dehalococcoidales bacterium]|nr:M48 family metallopeptidase [Dehalococcoidales bacterium]